jgi:hypothetical protein
VNHARAWVSGSPRPAVSLCAAALAVAFLVAACGSSLATPSGPIGTASPEPSLPATASTPAVTASPAPSDTAAVTPSVDPNASATPEPTPTATAGGLDAAAAACFGKPATRDFFVAIAEAVSWNVYCAVLPAGWSVDAGSYRLANGGQMVISYKTATGGHLELREGHWCTDSAATCSPHDSDIGPANLGAEAGELMGLGGGFVLYVNPGAAPSWTATATGIDEATFRQLCGNVALVKA